MKSSPFLLPYRPCLDLLLSVQSSMSLGPLSTSLRFHSLTVPTYISFPINNNFSNFLILDHQFTHNWPFLYLHLDLNFSLTWLIFTYLLNIFNLSYTQRLFIYHLWYRGKSERRQWQLVDTKKTKMKSNILSDLPMRSFVTGIREKEGYNPSCSWQFYDRIKNFSETWNNIWKKVCVSDDIKP